MDLNRGDFRESYGSNRADFSDFRESKIWFSDWSLTGANSPEEWPKDDQETRWIFDTSECWVNTVDRFVTNRRVYYTVYISQCIPYSVWSESHFRTLARLALFFWTGSKIHRFKFISQPPLKRLVDNFFSVLFSKLLIRVLYGGGSKSRISIAVVADGRCSSVKVLAVQILETPKSSTQL